MTILDNGMTVTAPAEVAPIIRFLLKQSVVIVRQKVGVIQIDYGPHGRRMRLFRVEQKEEDKDNRGYNCGTNS